MKIKNLLMAAVALVCAGVMTSCSDDEPKKKLVILNGAQANFGTAENVVWTDATVFNGEMYSLVVSLDKSGEENVEKYELYKSADGAAWTKVEYTVDGQAGLIGGEGARLVVNNGKLYVFSGMRTMGKDVLGGEAEVSEGWFGLEPVVYFRVWESTDGVAFNAVTGLTYMRGETDYTSMMDMFASPYSSVVSYKGKIVAQGGYMVTYGMSQPGRLLLVSEDGKAWEQLAPVDAEGNSFNLTHVGGSLFELNGKLFLAGGFNNFISPNFMTPAVMSTEDLTTWTAEETNLPALYQSQVVCDGKVAYLFGAETLNEEGNREMVPAVYKSVDGINWEQVATPEGYEGYRLASAVAYEGYAYFFGGYNSISSGNYACPGETDTYATKTWNIKF